MAVIAPSQLTTLAADALAAAGASPAQAQATARALVAADLDGLATHGVSRIPLYVDHLTCGRADGAAEPKLVHSRGGSCLIDVGGGLAYLGCALAVEQAIERARSHGIAIAALTNSHHYGAAVYHLEPIAAQNLVGLAFTNSPGAINAWGGKRPVFGTNPVAAAFPRKGKPPLLIDLSLTEVTRGKIMLAAKAGKPIPEGWAVDKDGNPTTDAKAALTGSLFAIGGVKGAMLALMVELLCCALTGAALAFENDSYFEPGNKPRIGHAFIAIDPGALAGDAVYFERVEALISAMLADPGVRLPGDRRHAERARLARTGLDIPDELLTQLRGFAQRA
jgi:(2R)-3-sulfolactate dehydrogenase (NADP+)